MGSWKNNKVKKVLCNIHDNISSNYACNEYSNRHADDGFLSGDVVLFVYESFNVDGLGDEQGRWRRRLVKETGKGEESNISLWPPNGGDGDQVRLWYSPAWKKKRKVVVGPASKGYVGVFLLGYKGVVEDNGSHRKKWPEMMIAMRWGGLQMRKIRVGCCLRY